METMNMANGYNVRLKVKPYGYQREGIDFGLRHERVLIGDEPGLGKTLQSIGIVDAAGAYPCLVICPSSLKINWQREWEKFTEKKAIVLDNGTQTTWPYLLQMEVQNVAIVNYESLRKYFVWDIKGGKKSWRLKDIVFCPHIKLFKSVIVDESHRVKDATTQQARFVKGLSVGKKWVILLSGTPVVNRPADLVAQLSIMDRLKDFGGKAAFLERYGGGESGKGNKSNKSNKSNRTYMRGIDDESADADAPKNLDELSRKLYASCMIRREKAKVLAELPDKTRCDLYVEISNREEYDVAQADLAQYLKEYRQCSDWEVQKKMMMEALVKFMTLRSIASKGKVAQAADFIRTFLASGKKLIVFCSLHEIVDALKREFPRAVTVTGRDSAAAKQAAVDGFQNDDGVRLIICSIKAAGVGLTLTAASDVAFIELPWTYADCCQCEDRAHRIGQKDNVTCYYLLGKDTIDGRLYQIIQDKKSVAAQIMASDDDIPTDRRYFEEIVSTLFEGK